MFCPHVVVGQAASSFLSELDDPPGPIRVPGPTRCCAALSSTLPSAQPAPHEPLLGGLSADTEDVPDLPPRAPGSASLLHEVIQELVGEISELPRQANRHAQPVEGKP
jgi:hypothetical protein